MSDPGLAVVVLGLTPIIGNDCPGEGQVGFYEGQLPGTMNPFMSSRIWLV